MELRTGYSAFESEREKLISGEKSQKCQSEHEKLMHHNIKLGVSKPKADTDSQSLSRKKVKPLHDVIKDINVDKPNDPGLRWVENTKTRSELLAMHRKKIKHESTMYRKTRPRCKGETSVKLSHSFSEPVISDSFKLRRKPRQLGPLSHMETEENDFGKSKTLQVGAVTQSDLLTKRHELLLQGHEKVAKQSDHIKVMEHMEKMGYIANIATPWWHIGKTEKELEKIKEKQERIKANDYKRHNSLSPKPTEDPEAESLKEKIRIKELKTKVTGKITNHPGFDLKTCQVRRCTQKDRFTDVVIEFKLAGQEPLLDENGMSLEFDQREDAPMYSSFSEDNLFLNPEERKTVEKMRKQAELLKRRSRRLPKKTYLLDCGDSASRPYTSPSQVSQDHYYKQLNPRNINSAPNLFQPKRVNLLTRGSSRGNKVCTDLGVRTGGFQCINYNQIT